MENKNFYSVSEYLFEILTWNRKNQDHVSMDVAQAKLIHKNPEKRDARLDTCVRKFIGRYYDEIIKLYNDEGYPTFCDEIERLYQNYAEESEAYEKEQAEGK